MLSIRLALAGSWQPMPQPADWLVRDVVVDKEGKLWVSTPKGRFWWDGRAWHKANQAGVGSGNWGQKLFGGGDRDVYVTRSTGREHEGGLYKLQGRRFVKVASYYYDGYHAHAGLYVSRAGDVFNYTGRFVAVLIKGKWVTAEAALGKRLIDVTVLDRSPDGPVLFFNTERNVACIWDGRAFKVGETPPGFPAKGQRTNAAVAWGEDRVILVLGNMIARGALWAARFGKDAAAVDMSAIVEQIGAKTLIRGAWGAPDGSVWLAADPTGRRKAAVTRGFLYRISPRGEVRKLEAIDKQGRWFGPLWNRHPRSVVQTRDGTVWFGLIRGGILRVDDGEQTFFDWRQGYVSHGTYWIVKTPDDKLYACGDHQLFTWSEDIEPNTSLTREWEQVIAVNPDVVRDPSGGMWVLRADRPKQVSRWDGEKWIHMDLGFPAPEHPRHIMVDDNGRMILEWKDYTTGRVSLVGPDGCRRFKRFHEAIAAAVAAGARRFVTHKLEAKRITGPVVSPDGRIWFYDRDAKIHFFARGQWQEAPHSRVRAMCIDEQGQPLFLDDKSVWTYRNGRIVDLARTHPKVDALKFALPGGRYAGRRFPYYKGLPEAFLREQMIFAHDTKRRGRWYPVSWRAARQIEAGYPGRPPLDAAYPEGGVLTRGGTEGLWIGNQHRWAGGQFIQNLLPKGTPFNKWHWKPIGIDAGGHLWVNNGRTRGAFELFFRKSSGPSVKARNLRVVRGRRILFEWDSDENVVAAIFRGSSAADWELSRSGQPATWNETRPGQRKITLELRAMDSIGGLGATTRVPVEVNVRLPRTRWTSKALPGELNDILWRPPVAAEWAFKDVPRRIEFRINKGFWQPLHQGSIIPLLQHNGKAVRIALRAIEEETFADPKPLAVDARIRFNIGAAIERRVRVIMSGNERERARAAKELKLVRQKAIPALSAKSQEIRRSIYTGGAADKKELQPILQQLEQALAIVQGK